MIKVIIHICQKFIQPSHFRVKSSDLETTQHIFLFPTFTYNSRSFHRTYIVLMFVCMSVPDNMINPKPCYGRINQNPILLE